MAKPTEFAIAKFDQGCNCAQSVLSAFAAPYGLDEKTALKLASPFGGGVARRGHICGAVTGGLLALGLARGASTVEEKEEIYLLGQEFLLRFEARHQTILCRDLIGIDISQPEERRKAREAGIIETRCRVFVRDAVEIAQQLLDPADKRVE